ncbi:MAG: ATP-dependent DNA helicase RecG [Methanothrix sp.]|nr:ATP-dependent DNA helicase RecG [Methanothrix sp.]
MKKADSAISESQSFEIRRIAGLLMRLFNGFDSMPVEGKKGRLGEAIRHVAEMKALVKGISAKSGGERWSATLKNEGNADVLSSHVRSLRGVGPRIAEYFARKGLFTIEDLLYFLPRQYEDRRIIYCISELVPGLRQTTLGKVTRSGVRFFGKRRIFEVTLDDGHGVLNAKWFEGRGSFLRGTFTPGRRVVLSGEVSRSPFEKEMIHPDYEILEDNEDQSLNFKRIVPIYSETEGLHQKTLRRIMWQVVRDYARLLQSPIPDEVSRKHRLMDIREAIRQLHFPDADQDIQAYQDTRSDAHKTLIFGEFFSFQLGLALQKRAGIIEQGISFKKDGEMKKRFYDSLPFTLTGAQQRVVEEIERDMASSRSMNRLLQGDVGSGKTVVSMVAMITACENGYQSALMAPTEILAAQHYRKLKAWSEKVGINIELLTSSIKEGDKRKTLARLMTGEIDIVIGTHALIQEGVVFRKLGLVVIDEQHRFGVIQRVALRKKGMVPDLLVMTATPIPRTLAMTLYGDLDVSTIDELPPGKKAIRTKVFFEDQRTSVYEIISREIRTGNQVFIVYPLVEESDSLNLRDAVRMANHLQREIFPCCRVGLIHGRMKAGDKDRIMTEFTRKKIQILVATTIIEVGVDIPEASLIVIEHAERFGLSQLHQLRGRVGRSDIPSYCILLAQRNGSADARKRLRIMEDTNDGFRIAEEDLAIRGPGEFMGTRQSGLPDFRVANIIRDGRILSDAKSDAFSLVAEDPHLEKKDHSPIKEVMLRRWGGRLDLGRTG